MESDVAPRVCEGVAFLDANVPGWEQMLDLTTLELSSTERCVLGQIWHYKHRSKDEDAYFSMLGELGIHDGEARRLGFNTVRLWVSGEGWDDLTQAWKEAVQERLAVA